MNPPLLAPSTLVMLNVPAVLAALVLAKETTRAFEPLVSPVTSSSFDHLPDPLTDDIVSRVV